MDYLIVIGFLLSMGFSALFSGLETAVISVNRVKLHHLAAQGHTGAQRLTGLLNKMEMLISACLIGNNITLITASVMVGTFLHRHQLSDKWTALAAVSIETVLFLFAGEIIPKAFARSRAILLALRLLPLLRVMLWLFYPLLILIQMANERWLSGSSAPKNYSMSREEMEHLFELGSVAGVIDNEGSEMINDVFEFGNTTAREVMVPTINIVSAELKRPLSEVAQLIYKHGYSRIPIYEDRVDNLIGYVAARSLLRSGRNRPLSEVMLKTILYIPLTKKISDLYVEMKSLQINIAFAVNEYGAVAGMISPEDIVEEVVGEIQTMEHPRDDLIVRLDNKNFLVDAVLNIDELNKIFQTNIQKEGFQTVGGFIAYRFGKIPSQGEKISLADHVFTVAEATQTSIKRLHLRIKSPQIEPKWKGDKYGTHL